MSNVTPVIQLAANGLVNNTGLGISANVITSISNYDSSPITTLYSDVAAAMINANILWSNVTFTTYLTNNVTVNLNTHINAIAPSTKTKEFVALIQQVGGFGSASAKWAGASTESATKSFSDYGLGINNFSSMLSGGMASVMSAAGALSGSQADVSARITGAFSGLLGEGQAMLQDGISSLQKTSFSPKLPSKEITEAVVTKFKQVKAPNGQMISYQIDSGFPGGLLQNIADASNSINGVIDKTSSILSGAISGPVSKVANFSVIGQSLSKLGSLFDPNTVGEAFSPANMITNIRKQGFTFFDDKLAEAGVDLTGISSANPDVLKQVLANTSKDEAHKIVKAFGLKLDDSSKVTNLGDLLEANKILSSADFAAIPGQSLSGLNNAVNNMGGQFKSISALSNHVSSMEIPSLPNLDNLTKPITAGLVGSLTSNLAIGLGTGPLSNPTMLDMIGSVSGHINVSALSNLIVAHSTIAGTPLGAALISAGDNFISSEDPADLIAFVEAQDALTTSSDPVLVAARASAIANESAILAQIAKEEGMLASAEVSLPVAPANLLAILSFAESLHSKGIDKQKLKWNEFIIPCVTNDVTGDAIRASLIEGRQLQAGDAAGITNLARTDPDSQLQKA